MFLHRSSNYLPKYLAALCLTGTTLLFPLMGAAQQPGGAEALARMPVKEVTIFKDGHALVVHEGVLPTDAQGDVAMDYLPTPILGTFWPYALAGGPKLTSVVASPRRIHVARTALTIKEMIASNTGSTARIFETGGKQYTAIILGIPTRSAEEMERTSPPGADLGWKVESELVLLKTSSGTEAMPISRIQNIAFEGKYNSMASMEEKRNLLTLKLQWPVGKPARTAKVGMLYVQKGLRWIPSYKIELDGKGEAVLSLQATLVNELTDLQDCTANLVIGVPKFYFQDQIDPIALQQTVAQLSNYFAQNSPTGYALSNGIMGQAGGFGGGGGGFAAGRRGAAPGGGSQGEEAAPEVSNAAQNEDLFVYTVNHITLKKGQRLTMPVRQFHMKYTDLYTVDIPIAPPRELRMNNNMNEQQLDQLRAANMPKAEHKVRLINESTAPITTAPALILSGGKVIAQAQIGYTAPRGSVDLTLTTALNLRVKKSDNETSRTPDVANFQGTRYARFDLKGTINITNFGETPATLEVTRNVLGNVGKAEQDGVVQMVNTFEDDTFSPREVYSPFWWGWYSWPYGWNHFNGIGRITWSVKLDPSKSIDLGYTWSYFWP